MHSYYTFIAMDLAQQRVGEAEQRRQLHLSRNPDAATERSFRRAAAVAIAAVSRVSGRLARRLDEGVVLPTR